MLAVCRGKVSEGIDFTNDNARAVVLFGIPYPHVKDPVVSAKKGYNNAFCASRGLLSGEEWYSLQAFRALNQALGRCIRHKDDYGAIVMLDERFASERVAQGLSAWVRGNLVQHKSLALATVSLGNFFQRLQRDPPGGGEGGPTELPTSTQQAAGQERPPLKPVSPPTPVDKNQSRISELFSKVKTPSPAKAVANPPAPPVFIDLGGGEDTNKENPSLKAPPLPRPMDIGVRTAEKLSHAGLSVDDIASAFDSPPTTQQLLVPEIKADNAPDKKDALEAAGWSLDDMDTFFTPQSATREECDAPVFNTEAVPSMRDLSGE